ncbi:manganese transporter pdt1 [Favolaschia claudopus]|uniref:Manganese transporter pdt1 n=1 Tax=Favolaschia claudopus TaxID=2862362 RepID=A0AAW0D083_9AGAR
MKSLGSTIVLHLRKHAGVGVVCAVAYFDPGNWGVDLQAGSQFGYRLLFVVLVAGLFGAFLQALLEPGLASHCRLLLYDRPKHPLLYRRLVLYPLYVLSEVAIISTDLAELLGSAIALNLLFPNLKIWHGVLITAFDVVVLLALRDPLRSTPVKMFEILIAGLVLAVLVCMVMIVAKVDVGWAKAFQGFLPSKFIFADNALYISVGIIGATVMPHSLFLGSALATQDRLRAQQVVSPASLKSREVAAKPGSNFAKLQSLVNHCTSIFRPPPPSSTCTTVTRHEDRENNPLAFIRAHLNHGIFDVVGTASVFFYGSGSPKDENAASLYDAYNLIHDAVGPPAATFFAIALLAAGQSSSIIATVAGQAVSEGFLNWRVSPVVRRLLTRLIAVIPALIVAVAAGRSGIDALLIISQVVLSIVLPFITLPLIYLTSSKTIMRARKTVTEDNPESSNDASAVDYSNNLLTTLVGLAIWLVMVAANGYVIVTLIIDARR